MILRGNLYAQSLRMETGIQVLTPRAFRAGEPCRVCYLLHPLEGNCGDWLDKTLLPLWAEKGDTIFIMPEGQRSFYVDMKYGLPYFTYVSEELPELMRQVFHISARREDTAIMGASMGGFAALRAAFLHPETFGFCGALAPACLFMKQFLEYQRTDPGVLHGEFAACFGDEMTWSPEYELTELAEGCRARFPRLYLAVGTQDHLRRPAMRFADFLEKNQLPCRFEQWEGAHDWDFFGPALKRALSQFEEY